MIELVNMCYVPQCSNEGTHSTNGGWMCDKCYARKNIAELRWLAYQYGQGHDLWNKYMRESAIAEEQFLITFGESWSWFMFKNVTK